MIFNGIDACNTWECINSFSGWVAGFGSLIIGGIALWLSVRDRYLQFSGKFTAGSIVSGAEHLNQEVYILEFVNIGVRPATVTSFKFWVPAVKKIKGAWLITFPQLDRRVSALCSDLPKKITHGDSGNIFFTEDFFRLFEQRESFLYPQNRLLARLRIQFFQIYLSTSIGQLIRIPIDRKTRKLLWKEYKSLHLQDPSA